MRSRLRWSRRRLEKNHRTGSVTTYPFNVFGGVWEENTPPHLSELPRKGNTMVGNDVWFGRECLILPGVRIGDGAMIAARSAVSINIEPDTIAGGNPARPIRKRFDDGLIDLLLRLRWWDFEPEPLAELLPLLCDQDLERVRQTLTGMLA
ncbi:MAG: CatB-related O-acetyltransferase [Anaerotruncus sp.]|nr:CatB-related O-acetyltransferase [Anaerotruncus sp.]